MSPERRRLLGRVVLGAGLALVVVVALVGVQVARSWSKVERIPLMATSDADGARFTAIVGTDGRPLAADPLLGPSFGDAETVKGERADLVVVMRSGGGRTTELLVVPRDIVIDGGPGAPGRLAVDWLDGPQAFIDRLCVGTGIPIDHVVALRASSLVLLVDAAGGLDVDVTNRIRDPRSKLAPIGPGRERLDGITALAWLRSRNPEVLTPKGWRPIADPAKGSLLRNERTPAVMRSVAARMSTRPWSSVPAFDDIAATLRIDDSASLLQMLALGRAVQNAPVVRPEVDQGRGRIPVAELTTAGLSTVSDFVGDERCTPSPA